MEAKRFAEITAKQIEIAKSMYEHGKSYAGRLEKCEKLSQMGLSTKHSTHDSIFFIEDEGSIGFRVIKFYNDGIDFRVAGGYTSMAEAYSEALNYL